MHRGSPSGPGGTLQASVTLPWTSRGQPAQAARSGSSRWTPAQAWAPGGGPAATGWCHRARDLEWQEIRTFHLSRARGGGDAVGALLPSPRDGAPFPVRCLHCTRAPRRSALHGMLLPASRGPGPPGPGTRLCRCFGDECGLFPSLFLRGAGHRTIKGPACGSETQTPTCPSCVCVGAWHGSGMARACLGEQWGLTHWKQTTCTWGRRSQVECTPENPLQKRTCVRPQLNALLDTPRKSCFCRVFLIRGKTGHV